MSSFATPAIMLRRIDFGDFDLIVTFLTLTQGKISAIAKSAKKSTKRFAGTLELFSVLELVCRAGRKNGLPVLEEVTLKQPFPGIRCEIKKTAYASYWAEIINEWMEEKERHEKLYRLFAYVLSQLDEGAIPEAQLSIQFQIRFLKLAGLSPNLSDCGICRSNLESAPGGALKFDLVKGSIACEKCMHGAARTVRLSRGTIKQLRWLESDDLNKASRIRFSPAALSEGLSFLEAFVPFYLGKKPRSLTFLQQVRR